MARIFSFEYLSSKEFSTSAIRPCSSALEMGYNFLIFVCQLGHGLVQSVLQDLQFGFFLGLECKHFASVVLRPDELMSDAGVGGVTSPPNGPAGPKKALSQMSPDELVQKCKSLLQIASKAKAAKDDAVKSLEREADKSSALEEMVQNLTEQKVQFATDQDLLKKQSQKLNRELDETLKAKNNFETQVLGKERQLSRLVEENEQLLKQLDDLDSNKQQLREQVAQIQDSLQKADVDIQALGHERDGLKDELRGLIDEKESMESSKGDNEDFARNLEHVKSENEELRGKNQGLEDENNTLKGKNEAIKAENERLAGATQEAETAKEELQSVNRELASKNEELVRHCATIETNLEEKAKALQDLEVKVAKVQDLEIKVAKVQELEALVDDREERIKSLEAEDQTKNGQIETLETEKKELWEKFEALQNESVLQYRGKDESISELNQKLNHFKELESVVEEQNELVKQLKFDSKSNEEEITDLTRKLEDISILESNLTDKTQIIARMESESTDKDKQIMELNKKIQKIQELEFSLAERNRLVEDLRAEQSQVELECRKKDNLLLNSSNNQAKVDQSNQELAQLSARNEELSLELARANEDSNQNQERAKDELQAKRSQILKLSDELEVTAAQVQGLQSEVEAYQSQLKSVPALKEEIDELIKNQDHLKHELEDLNHLKAQKEAELQVLQNGLDQSVAQLAHKDEEIVALRGRLNGEYETGEIVKNFEEQVQRLTKDVVSLQEEKASIQSNVIQPLQVSIESHLGDISKRDEEILLLKSNQVSLKASQAGFDANERTIFGLQISIDSLQKELNTEQHSNKVLAEEECLIVRLGADLEASEQKISILTGNLTNSWKSVQTLQSQFTTFKEGTKEILRADQKDIHSYVQTKEMAFVDLKQALVNELSSSESRDMDLIDELNQMNVELKKRGEKLSLLQDQLELLQKELSEKSKEAHEARKSLDRLHQNQEETIVSLKKEIEAQKAVRKNEDKANNKSMEDSQCDMMSTSTISKAEEQSRMADGQCKRVLADKEPGGHIFLAKIRFQEDSAQQFVVGDLR
eukprot:snap_masked-scaffold383_size189472-processed-gene-0.8 protein:Tk11346 transcript:snap_masked-scaffold383_size189472-processed-gene-0.8-mRNA-1 annotation:"kinesin k39"